MALTEQYLTKIRNKIAAAIGLKKSAIEVWTRSSDEVEGPHLQIVFDDEYGPDDDGQSEKFKALPEVTEPKWNVWQYKDVPVTIHYIAHNHYG